MTLATGGLFAVISGAAIISGGASLIISPIQKLFTNEHMTAKETVKDVALSATIGAITGPIGSAGSAIGKSASAATRLVIRAAAGSSAGAVSGAVSETVRAIKGEEVTSESYIKSMLIGAAVGGVGGASTHAASSISNKVSSEVGQVATRLAVQGTAAAATDAGLQLAVNGKIDAQQLIINTTGQLAVATTAEVSSSMVARSSGFNKTINDEKIKSSNLSNDQAKEVRAIIDEANKLDSSKLTGQNKVGKYNIHALERDRVGQIAGDIGGHTADGGRGAGRVILDKINEKYVISDHTLTHDYKNCKPVGMNEVWKLQDRLLRSDQINANLIVDVIKDEDSEDVKKKEI